MSVWKQPGRQEFSASHSTKQWVVKIGSQILVDSETQSLDTHRISALAEDIFTLRGFGISVVLVVSAAVAVGRGRVGDAETSRHVAAALGQSAVTGCFHEHFHRLGIPLAQILVGEPNVSTDNGKVRLRGMLTEIAGAGGQVLINGNDALHEGESWVSNNDLLAAKIARLLPASALVLLTDQDGLYDRDPRQHPEAKLISMGRALDPRWQQAASSSKGNLGTGGMQSKIQAARDCARLGVATLIARGDAPNVLTRLLYGTVPCTRLLPGPEPLGKKRDLEIMRAPKTSHFPLPSGLRPAS